MSADGSASGRGRGWPPGEPRCRTLCGARARIPRTSRQACTSSGRVTPWRGSKLPQRAVTVRPPSSPLLRSAVPRPRGRSSRLDEATVLGRKSPRRRGCRDSGTPERPLRDRRQRSRADRCRRRGRNRCPTPRARRSARTAVPVVRGTDASSRPRRRGARQDRNKRHDGRPAQDPDERRRRRPDQPMPPARPHQNPPTEGSGVVSAQGQTPEREAHRTGSRRLREILRRPPRSTRRRQDRTRGALRCAFVARSLDSCPSGDVRPAEGVF